MPQVILRLFDDRDGTTETRERLDDPIAAAARAHDLSHRMTLLGVRHTVHCRSDDNRSIPFRDARGRVTGPPIEDPEGLGAYLSAKLDEASLDTPFTLDSFP